ncbi:restriction endonuclease subunit S [Aquirufa nivalisilvae]|uniref:restriction endonuclease subunit S n=1 Tax=Aquirufa nivalisilvae TaxID=2516557 RepID=UPI0010327C2F|nr:restriction endonuclease subunit S [Aquirufa nivalisilvae]TBH76268.1 hypothetical protein EWU22_01595 [Aquirufa nivalisilvae]
MMAETINTKAFYNTEIPEGWEIRKLGDVGKIRMCKRVFNHETREEGDIPFFKIGTFGKEPDAFISNELYENYRKRFSFPKVGDILISAAGTLGRTVVYNGSPAYFQDSNIVWIDNEESIVTNSYLFYIYQSIKYESEGGTIQRLYNNIISDAKFLRPLLPEQKAIAQVLSTADAAIHTTEKLIAQKELRKKWLMQQLLTGKKRLKGFGERWKEHSYENILNVVKRNFDWDENELYKLISVRRRSGGIFYREALYGHQILVKTLRTAKEGDFLFSKMQILHGASALVTKEFDGAKISGSYIAVVPQDKKQLNMEFFQWYSQTPYFYHQTYISSYGVHIEKMTFDFNTFLQLEMKLPSIEEQTAIAQVLQAADKEISLLKAKAEKLREQKKGLMQMLLTGKKRLID